MSYLGNSLESQVMTPAVDTFSGNGSTTAFTLSRGVVSNYGVEAYVNNVAQDPNSAFSINASNQIVFTSAPSAGVNNIYVRYNSYIAQHVGIGQGTVGTSQLGSISNINSIGSDLTLQINGSDVIDCKTSGDVGIGGDPSTFNLNPRLLVRGPWASPTATGAYGGVFVASTDALAADKGGTVSLGGVYDGAGSYTRYAAIAGYKNNATSGDYGGYMALYTRANGAAPAESMRISSSGQVTMPRQAYVTLGNAGQTASVVGSTDGSVFQNFTSPAWLYVIDNSLGYWNGSSFSCPVTGIYQVSISGIKYPQAGVLHIDLRRNGVAVDGGRTRAEETATYCQYGSTYLVKCSAGDTLSWWGFGGAGFHSGHGIWSIRLAM